MQDHHLNVIAMIYTVKLTAPTVFHTLMLTNPNRADAFNLIH